MQKLFVRPLDNQAFDASCCQFMLDWVQPLLTAWGQALKSPVIAVKTCAATQLCHMLQQFYFLNGYCDASPPVLSSFYDQLDAFLASNFSLHRTEKLVVHRMNEEKSSYPICSEYHRA